MLIKGPVFSLTNEEESSHSLKKRKTHILCMEWKHIFLLNRTLYGALENVIVKLR